MERRNTIQRDLVLNAVRTMRRHVTADEVYQFISKDHPSVSKGTVYRNLNLLSDAGDIKKIEVPNGSEHFDFTLEDHYHIQCISCKKVFDVDMKPLPDLIGHVKETHGMKYLSYELLFRGICKECQE